MSDRKHAINGAKWTTISTIVIMVAQFFRIIILIRFLEKSDFGIVSIISVVLGLCTSLGDLGFASVIMYRKDISKKEFSSLFWVQFIVFSFLYFLLLAFSGLIANFYNFTVLKKLIPISSLALFFLGIGRLYDSILQKKYQFKLLAVRNVISAFTSVILAFMLAIFDFGVYSLIFSTLFQIAFYNIWNLISGFKYQKVELYLNVKEIKSLLSIGLFQTYTRILDYLSGKLDVLIIGKLLGADILGMYDLAKELAFKVVNTIQSIVFRVALPILSNNSDDSVRVVCLFYKITKAISYICFPVCVTIVVFSKYLVMILYGEKYIEIAPIVSIFGYVAMITCILSPFDILAIIKGRTYLCFYNTVLRILLSLIIISVSCLYSIEAVSWGHFLISLLMFIVMWKTIIPKTYNLSMQTFINQFLKIGFALLMLSVILYYVVNYNIFKIESLYVQIIAYSSLYLFLLLMLFVTFLKPEFVVVYNFVVKNK